jgi:hypothetical protein
MMNLKTIIADMNNTRVEMKINLPEKWTIFWIMKLITIMMMNINSIKCN